MQDLLHKLPGVIYEYVIRKDGSRSFTQVSENSEEILGISAGALLKDELLIRKIIHPDDLSSFELSQQTSHDEKAGWNWEGRIMYKDSFRWIETRSSSINHEDDNLRKGIIIDITARKQLEEDHELRYQALVESLPLGLGIYCDQKIVVANVYAHKLLHANPSELIGQNVLDFVHPSSKSIVISRMKKVLAGEAVPVAEEKFICTDGKVIDVETTALPFKYKGKPAVQLIVRDITEHKRTKDEIRKNETFFSQLFNNLPIAVVKLDETGRIELVNPGFTEIFGYSHDELKGKNLNDFIVPEQFKNEGIDINNLVTSNKVIQVEAVRKNKSGKLVNVLLYGMPVWLEDVIIGIYGVYVDITKLKQMEEELKVRNAELDNFVYKVSHDLRAPLSSILGLVNLSTFKGNTDSPYEYLNLIGEKAKGLDHFISDVLSHSKNLKLDVTITRVDIKEIILRTIDELSYLEGAEDVTFEINAQQHEFYSDPWRIREVFRNLVSNAIKYRQHEGPKPHVKIDVTAADDSIKIVFADNGIGIEKLNLDKIFEMFYRATAQSDGSGIGLYIVKNAVEKLKGTITADSIVNKGTTFTLDLPNQNRQA